jgi:hypothetical protein
VKKEDFFKILTEEYNITLVTNKKEYLEVQRLRKEIYSNKFSLTEDILEKEGFLHFNQEDKQSFIFLLRHNESNVYVGTIRVMFLNQRTPIQELLMQKEGGVGGVENFIELLPVGEISRFALTYDLADYDSMSKLRLRTFLAAGLMVATRISFFIYPPVNVFAFMEDALYRILNRQDVKFKKIGDSVDLHGLRTPYAVKREVLLIETEGTMRSITLYYLKQMCQNPEKLWEFVDNNPYLERSDIQLERICKLFKEYGDDVDIALLLGEDKG